MASTEYMLTVINGLTDEPGGEAHSALHGHRESLFEKLQLPAQPAARGKQLVGQWVCKENPFRKIKRKQREANRALRSNVQEPLVKHFRGITRLIVNSSELRKREKEDHKEAV